jgi:hypothetical protein
VVVLLVAVIVPSILKNKNQPEEPTSSVVVHEMVEEVPKIEEVKPIEYVDFTANRTQIVTEMNRINEPIPFGTQLIYSAGQTMGINEIVFDKLFLYDTETLTEVAIAQTKLTNKLGRTSGEIYEGRMNDQWIVWLDTNQSGTNDIYGLDRTNPDAEPFLIKSAELIRPQLRLSGNNLIWVEQANAGEDVINLYNFNMQEPASLYYFTNPTYGTCPPAVSKNIVVWVKPDPEDETKSIINWLDLNEELDLSANQRIAAEEAEGVMEEGSTDGADDAATEEGATSETEDVDAENPEFDPSTVEIVEVTDEELQALEIEQPQIGKDIDPEGFAIYPATNGEVIAWIDNLNPANASLKLKDGDNDIITIESGIGRFFAVGDSFVAYTKNDGIYLYFWETETYGRLTGDDEVGRLTQECVDGNTITWYGNDPKLDDVVYVSVIEQSSK